MESLDYERSPKSRGSNAGFAALVELAAQPWRLVRHPLRCQRALPLQEPIQRARVLARKVIARMVGVGEDKHRTPFEVRVLTERVEKLEPIYARQAEVK